MSIKILIASSPSTSNSYAELEKKFDVKVEFRDFTKVVPVEAMELKKIKFEFAPYEGVIFKSRNVVDVFFEIAKILRYNVPTSMKYFCYNQYIANYLQKYIEVKKRKTFFCEKSDLENFVELIAQNYNKEKLLLPVDENNLRRNPLITQLKRKKVDVNPIVFYKIVFEDLSDLNLSNYNILVLFTPKQVEALKHYFDKIDGNIVIAANGSEALRAAQKAKLNVSIKVNDGESMYKALESYLNGTK